MHPLQYQEMPPEHSKVEEEQENQISLSFAAYPLLQSHLNLERRFIRHQSNLQLAETGKV